MEIQVAQHDDRIILTMTGEFREIADCRELEQQLESARDAGMPVVLDMAGTTFMSSQAVGTLVFLAQGYVDSGSTLCIYNPSPDIHEIFRMTGLLDVLVIAETESELEKLLSAD